MKVIDDISKEEVLLSYIFLNIFDLEIENDILCKDDIIIMIDGKKIKMIKEGANEIDEQTVLFRPLKSKAIAFFLMQELMDIDSDISIFLEETSKKEKSVKILDSDRNVLSKCKNKDLKKCIVITLIKYFFGRSIEGKNYINIINDYK